MLVIKAMLTLRALGDTGTGLPLILFPLSGLRGLALFCLS